MRTRAARDVGRQTGPGVGRQTGPGSRGPLGCPFPSLRLISSLRHFFRYTLAHRLKCGGGAKKACNIPAHRPHSQSQPPPPPPPLLPTPQLWSRSLIHSTASRHPPSLRIAALPSPSRLAPPPRAPRVGLLPAARPAPAGAGCRRCASPRPSLRAPAPRPPRPPRPPAPRGAARHTTRRGGGGGGGSTEPPARAAGVHAVNPTAAAQATGNGPRPPKPAPASNH